MSGTKHKRILIVDDEPAVRDFVGVVLTMHGFEVLLAGGGAEALALASSDSDPIDLLLTDVAMPGMDGLELIAAMARVRARTPVLLMSGYDSALGRAATARLPLLAKPFRIEALLEAVEKVLAPRS